MTATAKKLTAHNEDIQRYIEQPNKSKKKAIIKEIKEKALAEGLNFNSLFPKNTKRYEVLDAVAYMISTGGICKISRPKLAEKVGASVRTVTYAVENMEKLDCFIVGGLADGKNKYVFVYKNHDNFNEILANVFYIDSIEETSENDNNAQQIAQQIAQQENAESTGTQGTEGDKMGSILAIPIISKHEKEYIRESVENELLEARKEKKKEEIRVQEYCTNEYQQKIYYTLTGIAGKHYHPDIIKNASILALRAGSNCTEKSFHKALKAVTKIDRALHMGVIIITSIPALFTKIYTDRLKYADYYIKQAEKHQQKQKRDTSFYYNWLLPEG